MNARPVSPAAALWLGLVSSSAQAAKTACLSPAEAESLIVAVMPSAIESLAQRCGAQLPADATLRAGLPPIAERYRVAREGVLEQASVAAAKVLGENGDGLASSTMVDLFGQITAREVVKGVKPDDCVKADRIIALLAPLPPRNVAGLIVSAIGWSSRRDMGAFTLCPADKP